MERVKRYTEPISFFVMPEMQEHLESLARQKKMTVSEYIRELLNERIKKNETILKESR